MTPLRKKTKQEASDFVKLLIMITLYSVVVCEPSVLNRFFTADVVHDKLLLGWKCELWFKHISFSPW